MRPIIARGFGGPGIDPRNCPEPTLIVSAYPFPPFLGADPIKLFTSAVVRKAPRSLGAHVKSLNYLDAIVAKQQAGELGMHDAVMLDSLGAVAECTGANLFILVGDTLVTPTTRAALPGITRRTVLEIAAEEGIAARGARRLAGRAALRRRRVRLRLRRRRRPDRLLRRAPGRAARTIRSSPASRTPTRSGPVPPRTGRSSTLPSHEVLSSRCWRSSRCSHRRQHRPRARRIETFAKRDALTHGIAGDERYVFVTEPGIGVAPDGARVVALDRSTGREVAALPAPEGGFKLPFTLRVPRTGHLVVLDSGGFPPVGPPVVYDYAYSTKRGALKAKLTRTTSFAGLPLAFAEDVDVLPNGEYVVSESIFGGLWLIGRDGEIRRGLVPDDGAPPLHKLGPCQDIGVARTVGDLPFAAPAASSRAPARSRSADRDLYISSTCEGGIQRLPISVLLDASKPAAERAMRDHRGHDEGRGRPREPQGHHVQPLGPERSVDLRRRPVPPEADPRELAHGQARGRSPTTRALFNFTVAATFLPPLRHQRAEPAGDDVRSGVPLERRPTPRSTASITSSRRSSGRVLASSLASGRRSRSSSGRNGRSSRLSLT